MTTILEDQLTATLENIKREARESGLTKTLDALWLHAAALYEKRKQEKADVLKFEPRSQANEIPHRPGGGLG